MSYFEGPCLELYKQKIHKDKPKQVVVIGSPRGGTSMVSGVLHHMGIHMGSFDNKFDQGYLTYEDPRFVSSHKGDRSLFSDKWKREKCVNQVLESILASNNLGETWGWKDPLSIHYITDVLSELDNPILVYVWRSPISIAKGEMRFQERSGTNPGDTQLYSHMANITKHYQMMHDVSSTVKLPSIHINYEHVMSAKASKDKKRMVRDLSGFCGMKLTDETIDLCALNIKNGIKPCQKNTHKEKI